MRSGKTINKMKKMLCGAVILSAAFFYCSFTQIQADAATGSRVHFLSLKNSTDCILLESGGHYALIDSGEDWDYIPPDNADEEYPFRDEATTTCGFEQQVIHYLNELGVEKLDFYLGTHAHSDHIGSGDTILDTFPTDVLYLGEYDDSFVENPLYLWDNKYVYDQLLDAAKKNHVNIVQDFTNLNTLTLGDMTIHLLNTNKTDSEINDNSIVCLVTAEGRSALLTSDVGNYNLPLSMEIAEQTNAILSAMTGRSAAEPEVEEETSSGEATVILPEGSSLEGIAESASEQPPLSGDSGTIEEDINNLYSIPSTQTGSVTTEKTGGLDLLKLSHHGASSNNPSEFITALRPSVAVVTGSFQNVTPGIYAALSLEDSSIFSTNTDSSAVVATLSSDGVKTEYTTMEAGWYSINGEEYYFDQNGRTVCPRIDENNFPVPYMITQIEGRTYTLTYQGAKVTDQYVDILGVTYYVDADSYPNEASWYYRDGRWYYGYGQDTGHTYKDRWAFIENNWYYFDTDGVMQTGWLEYKGNRYYLTTANEPGTTGSMKKNWFVYNGAWYYANSSGVIQRGWISINDSYYYLSGDGILRTGWLTYAGKTYYLEEKASNQGVMRTGWVKYNNRWYYLNDNGVLRYGWYLTGGKWYYADKFGVMQTGWLTVDGQTYYLNGSGAMVKGWVNSGSKWYFTNDSGKLKTNCWYLKDGKWYHSDSSGVMQTGWLKLDGLTYYLNGSGAMQKGWIKTGSTWYYANGSGVIQTGWIKLGGNSYYLDPAKNGAMKTKWYLVGGKWYYSYASGVLAVNTVIDGKYPVNGSGEWIPGTTVPTPTPTPTPAI